MLHVNSNYIMMVLSKYVLECPIGFYRNSCSEKCIPPTYGEDCQAVCKCPLEECNFVTGCFQNLGTVTNYQQLRMVYFHFIWINFYCAHVSANSDSIRIWIIRAIYTILKDVQHACIQKVKREKPIIIQGWRMDVFVLYFVAIIYF